MKEIGISNFAGMCSNSTGNTKRGRKEAHEEVPTIIDLGDCCHRLHNTIKDVNKLPEFKSVSFVRNIADCAQPASR